MDNNPYTNPYPVLHPVEMEKQLFIAVCSAIASKDFDIDANSLVQYASSVCDGFRKRFAS